MLQQTSRQSSSPKVMLAQLEPLAGVLAETAVAAAAKKRAGKRTLDALTEAATALREADRATRDRAGTTAETQEMDLLDGIIVELVRQARDVALAAADELGDPAMAKAFKLDRLYRARHRSKEPIEAPRTRPTTATTPPRKRFGACGCPGTDASSRCACEPRLVGTCGPGDAVPSVRKRAATIIA